MIAQSKLRTRILILALFAIFCFFDQLIILCLYGVSSWLAFLRYNIIGISLRFMAVMLMVYPLIKEKLRWLTLISVVLLVVSLHCNSSFYALTRSLELLAFLAQISLIALAALVLIKPSEKRGCFAARIWFVPAAIQTSFLVYLCYFWFIEGGYVYYGRTLYERDGIEVLLPFIAYIILTIFFYLFSRWLVSPYKQLLEERKNCAAVQNKERKTMFDEKSPKWLRIFKGYTITMYCLDLLAAVILGILGWADALYWFEPFLDGIIGFAGGIFIAFGGLVVNMLILQFLSNVQSIREELERK